MAYRPTPEFLPVIFGHGTFLTELKHMRANHPAYLIPPHENFLELKPSLESRQLWPSPGPEKFPKEGSVVILALAINADCRDAGLITEIGYTVFDTAAIYEGKKKSRGCRANLPGCVAPGPRGIEYARFCTTRHFIVEDTADHRPDTCDNPEHTAQPYHFSFRKSEKLPRDKIQHRLEAIYKHASTEGLRKEDADRGFRRTVVLAGWGGASDTHPLVQRTTWFNNPNKVFQKWDILKYNPLNSRFHSDPFLPPPNPPPSLIDHLDAFGVKHVVRDEDTDYAANPDLMDFGAEIGYNAGNQTAFAIRLLLAYGFVTEDDKKLVDQKINLPPPSDFPGVSSILMWNNKAWGSKDLPEGHGPIADLQNKKAEEGHEDFNDETTRMDTLGDEW
ncbi:hypothetical protein GGS20DRAFT_591657 [Poronia punctata]|nr:hypothetical protein GGS20DRAFT_591657 [Poronia punctata]